MAETIHLTQRIKEVLLYMGIGQREKIALFLGERVSPDEIYVINTTGPSEGEPTSVSLERIFHVNQTLGAIQNANRYLSERNGQLDRFVLFESHSHSLNIGDIVEPGYTAWSVDDVPPEYNELRGKVTGFNDRGGSLIHLSIKKASDGKGGDDISLEETANKWRLIEHHLFVRPAIYLSGRPMTKEGVDVDCYKYDPQMKLGKIRKIEIAQRTLTPQDLMRTILDQSKPMVVVEEGSGNLVLPYR